MVPAADREVPQLSRPVMKVTWSAVAAEELMEVCSWNVLTVSFTAQHVGCDLGRRKGMREDPWGFILGHWKGCCLRHSAGRDQDLSLAHGDLQVPTSIQMEMLD